MGNLQTLKLEYEEYLRNQRGVSERSIYWSLKLCDTLFADFRRHSSPSLRNVCVCQFTLPLSDTRLGGCSSGLRRTFQISKSDSTGWVSDANAVEEWAEEGEVAAVAS